MANTPTVYLKKGQSYIGGKVVSDVEARKIINRPIEKKLVETQMAQARPKPTQSTIFIDKDTGKQTGAIIRRGGTEADVIRMSGGRAKVETVRGIPSYVESKIPKKIIAQPTQRTRVSFLRPDPFAKRLESTNQSQKPSFLNPNPFKPLPKSVRQDDKVKGVNRAELVEVRIRSKETTPEKIMRISQATRKQIDDNVIKVENKIKDTLFPEAQEKYHERYYTKYKIGGYDVKSGKFKYKKQYVPASYIRDFITQQGRNIFDLNPATIGTRVASGAVKTIEMVVGNYNFKNLSKEDRKIVNKQIEQMKKDARKASIEQIKELGNKIYRALTKKDGKALADVTTIAILAGLSAKGVKSGTKKINNIMDKNIGKKGALRFSNKRKMTKAETAQRKGDRIKFIRETKQFTARINPKDITRSKAITAFNKQFQNIKDTKAIKVRETWATDLSKPFVNRFKQSGTVAIVPKGGGKQLVTPIDPKTGRLVADKSFQYTNKANKNPLFTPIKKNRALIIQRARKNVGVNEILVDNNGKVTTRTIFSQQLKISEIPKHDRYIKIKDIKIRNRAIRQEHRINKKFQRQAIDLSLKEAVKLADKIKQAKPIIILKGFRKGKSINDLLERVKKMVENRKEAIEQAKNKNIKSPQQGVKLADKIKQAKQKGKIQGRYITDRRARGDEITINPEYEFMIFDKNKFNSIAKLSLNNNRLVRIDSKLTSGLSADTKALLNGQYINVQRGWSDAKIKNYIDANFKETPPISKSKIDLVIANRLKIDTESPQIQKIEADYDAKTKIKPSQIQDFSTYIKEKQLQKIETKGDQTYKQDYDKITDKTIQKEGGESYAPDFPPPPYNPPPPLPPEPKPEQVYRYLQRYFNTTTRKKGVLFPYIVLPPAIVKKLRKLKKKKKYKFLFEYTPTLAGAESATERQSVYTGFELRGSRLYYKKPITVHKHKRSTLKYKLFVRKHQRAKARFHGFSTRR